MATTNRIRSRRWSQRVLRARKPLRRHRDFSSFRRRGPPGACGGDLEGPQQSLSEFLDLEGVREELALDFVDLPGE